MSKPTINFPKGGDSKTTSHPSFANVALRNVAKQLNEEKEKPKAITFDVVSWNGETEEGKSVIDVLTALIGNKYTFYFLAVTTIIPPPEKLSSDNRYSYRIIGYDESVTEEGRLSLSKDLEEQIIDLINSDKGQKILKFLIDNTKLEFPE